MLRLKALAIEREREAAIEEGVVPQHVLDELGAEFEVLAEERLVWRELHERAVALVGLRYARLCLELSCFKIHDFRLALTDRLCAIVQRERVHRLLSDAVESDGFLKCLAVVFRACVDDRNAVHELSERDATSVVAHLHVAIRNLHLDPFSLTHHKLVDRVIDRLFQQHVNAVLCVRAVSESPNVHAWAEADVLQRAEGLDAGFGVVGCHGFVGGKRWKPVRADKRNSGAPAKLRSFDAVLQIGEAWFLRRSGRFGFHPRRASLHQSPTLSLLRCVRRRVRAGVESHRRTERAGENLAARSGVHPSPARVAAHLASRTCGAARAARLCR